MPPIFASGSFLHFTEQHGCGDGFYDIMFWTCVALVPIFFIHGLIVGPKE